MNSKEVTLCELRLENFQDSEIVSRIAKSRASVLSPKAKDCQRQINEASSVWTVDGKKFLFVFGEKTAGGQKVTVWGIKNPGLYQRIKTVLVTNNDDIFEAIPVFLTEYFELELGGMGYRVDEDWYLDIQDELAELSRHCPPHLKSKQKLLRVWSSLMPRLSELIISLDDKYFDPSPTLNTGTHDLSVPSSGTNDNSSLVIDHSSLERHRDWIPHLQHFLTLHEQGVSLRDFCLVKDLPYQEFLTYFNAAMAEMKSALEKEPILQKIAMLPAEDQDEYAILMTRQGELMPKLCECMSALIGEKIEVEDIKNHPDILKPKVMAMMERINRMDIKDAPATLRFLSAYGELERLDREIEDFHQRHGL